MGGVVLSIKMLMLVYLFIVFDTMGWLYGKILSLTCSDNISSMVLLSSSGLLMWSQSWLNLVIFMGCALLAILNSILL